MERIHGMHQHWELELADRLTPYQILDRSLRGILRNLLSSELYKVTQATFWIFQLFFHTKIEKGYAPFLYHIGISRNEDSIKP